MKPISAAMLTTVRERLGMTLEEMTVALGYAPGHHGHTCREKEAGRQSVTVGDAAAMLRLLKERRLPFPRKSVAPRMVRPRAAGRDIPLPATMPGNATLLALYDAGVSGPRLARFYGVTREAIRQRLDRAKRQAGRS